MDIITPTTILLETENGKRIRVGMNVIRESKVLTHAIDVAKKPDDDEEVMQVMMKKDMLDNIRTFCDFFKDQPDYIIPKNFMDNERLPSDSEPMKWLETLSPQTFYDLHEAINFLNMPRLTDTMCVFLLYKAQTSDIKSIRKEFGFRTDVTEEEEKAHREKFEKKI